jgi:hypothetical protein
MKMQWSNLHAISKRRGVSTLRQRVVDVTFNGTYKAGGIPLQPKNVALDSRILFVAPAETDTWAASWNSESRSLVLRHKSTGREPVGDLLTNLKITMLAIGA